MIQLAVGIDPGDKGGIVAIDAERRVVFEKRFYKQRVETFWFIHGIRNEYVFHILEEDVFGRLGNGTKQIFGFGKSCGYVRDLIELTLIKYTHEKIIPVMWKKEYSLLKKEKEAANDVVEKIFGEKTHIDLMDAKLLADLKWNRLFGGNII